mmetsp:Transcript_52982/g.114596  ORF Transcript_52982/g.114596 Transcript_52982/m.114596 type:complete len:208 (+) Transcript_52982:1400-2023(+)
MLRWCSVKSLCRSVMAASGDFQPFLTTPSKLMSSLRRSSFKLENWLSRAARSCRRSSWSSVEVTRLEDCRANSSRSFWASSAFRSSASSLWLPLKRLSRASSCSLQVCISSCNELRRWLDLSTSSPSLLNLSMWSSRRPRSTSLAAFSLPMSSSSLRSSAARLRVSLDSSLWTSSTAVARTAWPSSILRPWLSADCRRRSSRSSSSF